MAERDIAPHHDGLAAALHMLDYLHEEFEVFLTGILARVASAAEVKRLVAADIESVRTEKRDKLIYQARDKLDALLVRYVDRVVRHLFKPIHLLRLPILHFAEMLVLIALKEVVEVSERGKRRNELDEIVVAVIVERGDLLGGEHVLRGHDPVVLDEFESVLDVKLKRIDLIIREQIGDMA